MILLSKKLLKKNYTALTTLVPIKMVLFVWTNSGMHMFELIIGSTCVSILGGRYGTGGGWKFILTAIMLPWANQMC